MKPIYLLKVLNHHARHCGVHVFSGDRRCTCGRDKAIDELTTLLENQQPKPREELTVSQLRHRLANIARRITPRICAEGYQDETGFHFGKDPRNDRA